MNIKDIVNVFANTKFITDAMTFTSELLHIDNMIHYEQPFMTGSTVGEACSRLFFLCFRDVLVERYRNS